MKVITALVMHNNEGYSQITMEKYPINLKNKKEYLLENLPSQNKRNSYLVVAITLSITKKLTYRKI